MNRKLIILIVEKEKKSKKDRPITPSVKADSVMSDAASDRIRTLEIENSLLKAKLNGNNLFTIMFGVVLSNMFTFNRV